MELKLAQLKAEYDKLASDHEVTRGQASAH
jgi:hypothetical protein